MKARKMRFLTKVLNTVERVNRAVEPLLGFGNGGDRVVVEKVRPEVTQLVCNPKVFGGKGLPVIINIHSSVPKNERWQAFFNAARQMSRRRIGAPDG